MKFSPNDTRVKVIHEPREWGIVPFIIPLTPEREAELKEWRLKPEDVIHRTIYYVSPRDFYTFRREIITIITEKDMGHLDLINLREIIDFSFIQFIINNVVNSVKLEELKEKTGIDLKTSA